MQLTTAASMGMCEPGRTTRYVPTATLSASTSVPVMQSTTAKSVQHTAARKLVLQLC